MASSGSGKGAAVKPSCTVQYPFVRRFRERRLLSFLSAQGFQGAFRELAQETAALFDLHRMRRLVRKGRWDDALFYLSTFLPPLKSERRSLRARILHNFLLMHGRFADVVAGKEDKHLEQQYANGRSSSTQAERRFRSMNYAILAPGSGQLRAAIDWDRVRSSAEFVVRRMAHATPELQRPMVLPSGCMMPHDVLPIGTSFGSLFRRRRVKKQGPQPRKTEAILMALEFQQYCRKFRESSVGSKDDALELLVNFLDETLQAGLPRGCTLSYDLQPSGMEGAQACKSISTTLTVHAPNPGISFVKNEGAFDTSRLSPSESEGSTDNR